MQQFYGLIGRQLKHSFSKNYFCDKFKTLNLTDLRYKHFEIASIHEINTLLEKYPTLAGFNVTLPYKEEIIPYLHHIEPDARQIGAVNTVKVERDQSKTKLSGYNTDAPGFKYCIEKYLQPYHSKALIFGTGGSAKAIAYSLNRLKIEFKFVSRTITNSSVITYDQISPGLLASHKLLINCTPVGMYPHVKEVLPICYKAIGPEHLVFDLIYNPPVTGFLHKAHLSGAKIVNGLEMLYQQAELAWKIWNNI